MWGKRKEQGGWEGRISTTLWKFGNFLPQRFCGIINLCSLYERKRMSRSCTWLFVTPWTLAHQAPLSVGFLRQEYWLGEPFPSPGDLPSPGKELGSFCIAGRLFILRATQGSIKQINYLQGFSSRNNWHTGWTMWPIIYSMTLNFMWFKSPHPAHCFMAKHFLYLHLYSIPFFTSPGGLTAVKLSWQKPPHPFSDSFRGQRS